MPVSMPEVRRYVGELGYYMARHGLRRHLEMIRYPNMSNIHDVLHKHPAEWFTEKYIPVPNMSLNDQNHLREVLRGWSDYAQSYVYAFDTYVAADLEIVKYNYEQDVMTYRAGSAGILLVIEDWWEKACLYGAAAFETAENLLMDIEAMDMESPAQMIIEDVIYYHKIDQKS